MQQFIRLRSSWLRGAPQLTVFVGAVVSPAPDLYHVSNTPPRPCGAASMASAKELPMVAVLEQETTPATIEATVNYIFDNGEKIFTRTAAPGATDVRTGGSQDPRRVTIRNARLAGDEFALDRDGFRFVPHDTKVRDFFDEDEIRRVYYPEMEALVKARERSLARGGVRSHLADRRRRAARGAQDPRGGAPGAQRLHRMVGPAARTRSSSGRSRRAAQAPLRHRAGLAADPPPGREPPARDLRRPQHRIRGFRDLRAPLSEPDRPDLCDHLQSRAPLVLAAAMRRDEALVFKVYDSSKDGRARWSAHTAFDDPTSPPNARPRESIEIRTLAFF